MPSFAPYAPVRNVLRVIQRKRDRGLPDPVDVQVLQKVGVPEGNAHRTYQALVFLGLVAEDGYQTDLMERLGKAKTAEYPQLMGEIVRAAYHPVLTLIDPAEDNEIAVFDAFRGNDPQAQRARMVTLFLGLCEEAEMIPRRPRHKRASIVARRRQKGGEKSGAAGTGKAQTDEPGAAISGPGQLDNRLLSAVIQQLPADGTWTESRRSSWVQALISAVDLIVQVTDDEAS